MRTVLGLWVIGSTILHASPALRPRNPGGPPGRALDAGLDRDFGCCCRRRPRDPAHAAHGETARAAAGIVLGPPVRARPAAGARRPPRARRRPSGASPRAFAGRHDGVRAPLVPEAL